MDNNENKELFDLGEADNDFDPFELDDDELGDGGVTEDLDSGRVINPPPKPETPEPLKTEASLNPEQIKKEIPAKTPTSKEPKTDPGLEDKPPVFEYAGAMESIEDTSKTFEELRIEKSADFPELEDGKRVSWTVEYGKITKPVADPKGTSVGGMKSDIEISKEFLDSLKRAKDKNPACKIKPRVTAQSKGVASYKGVFINYDEAMASGKLITLCPARDGKVYETRQNQMGRFVTESKGDDILSDIRAGFTPALPLIPLRYLLDIISFFKMMSLDGGREALANIHWDTKENEYIVDIPRQAASPISVKSETGIEYDSPRYIHYMDIHSHHKMKAFFSATDDMDEKATRVYAVIGDIHNYFPDIKTRVSNGGAFLDIDPCIVFEGFNKKTHLASEWIKRARGGANSLAGKISFIFKRYRSEGDHA